MNKPICMTAQEAAAYTAGEIFTTRKKSISFFMAPGGCPLPENFLAMILNARPELLLCVSQVHYTPSAVDCQVRVQYSGAPDTVRQISTADEFMSGLYEAAKTHSPRFCFVFPQAQQTSIDECMRKAVQQPPLLNCYIQSVEPCYRRMDDCEYVGCQLTLSYTCSEAEHWRRERLIIREIEKICRLVRAKADNDRDLALAAAKYMADNLRYSAETPCDFTAFGALVKKKGSCMGMALAYQRICTELGILSRYITGQLEGESSGHAWNQVFLGGGWFHLDITQAVANGGAVNLYRTIREFPDRRSAYTYY